MYNKSIYVLDISTILFLGYRNKEILKSNLIYLLRDIFGVVINSDICVNNKNNELLDLLWGILYPMSYLQQILIEDISISNNELYIVTKGV